MNSGVKRTAIITAAIIAATVLLPWWSVALVGGAAGLFFPSARPSEAGLGGLLGWGGLLLLATWQGPLGVLLTRLGVLLHVPGAVLPLMAVLLAVLLGWSSASLGRTLRLALPAGERPA